MVIYNLNKSRLSAIGHNLLELIKNIHLIVEFLKNFYNSDTLNDLYNGLILWDKGTFFSVITHIENEGGGGHEMMMDDFIKQICLFDKFVVNSSPQTTIYKLVIMRFSTYTL